MFPALHNLISKWAPPHEKGKFLFALIGSSAGIIITWPLIGLIVESIGWIWSFYIPAGFTAFFIVLWYFCVFDTPSLHPRISAKEMKYIEDSLVGITLNKVSMKVDRYKVN